MHDNLHHRRCLSFLQARSMFQLPPRLSTADSDLGSALQQASMQCNLELDQLFDNVGLRFAVPGAGGDPAAAEVVSGPTPPS